MPYAVRTMWSLDIILKKHDVKHPCDQAPRDAPASAAKPLCASIWFRRIPTGGSPRWRCGRRPRLSTAQRSAPFARPVRPNAAKPAAARHGS